MFVEEHLAELRRERFTPLALLRYLRRVAGRSREHIVANPGAVRSIWSVALVFFAAAFLAAVPMALVYDRSLAYDFFLRTALWILPSFTVVTLYVGALRDRDGYALSAINMPTVLTLLRVALVPGITLFLLERHFALAFTTFVIAALTDVADGWLARRWNQVTRLGTVLDPLVDVVFNVAMFAGLVAAGLLAPWVLGVAVLRYGLLIVGGSCLYLFLGPVRIQPTLFGRLSGVVMADARRTAGAAARARDPARDDADPAHADRARRAAVGDRAARGRARLVQPQGDDGRRRARPAAWSATCAGERSSPGAGTAFARFRGAPGQAPLARAPAADPIRVRVALAVATPAVPSVRPAPLPLLSSESPVELVDPPRPEHSLDRVRARVPSRSCARGVGLPVRRSRRCRRSRAARFRCSGMLALAALLWLLARPVIERSRRRGRPARRARRPVAQHGPAGGSGRGHAGGARRSASRRNCAAHGAAARR